MISIKKGPLSSEPSITIRTVPIVKAKTDELSNRADPYFPGKSAPAQEHSHSPPHRIFPFRGLEAATGDIIRDFLPKKSRPREGKSGAEANEGFTIHPVIK